MSKTDLLHYELCCKGAAWMRRLDYGSYKYVVVELVCVGAGNPDDFGLLEWDGKKITVTQEADEIPCENHGELAVLCSIMRREGVKKGIFNYRHNKKDEVTE